MHICISTCTLFTVCLQHQNWIATKCKTMRCLSDLFSPMTYRLEYSLCHSGQAFFFSDWPLQCVPRLKLYMLQAPNDEHFKFWNQGSFCNLDDWFWMGLSCLPICNSEHVHFCTHNPIPHQKQGPQTLGTASMQPMLSGLLSGTMLSVMVMVK